MLPDGWCLTNIGELLINRDGERKPVSSAIRNKQVHKIYDYYGAAGVIDKVEDYLFDERLLLIGEDGANLLSKSKDNAFFAEGKYWVNNHAHVLDATNKELLNYVATVINAMELDDYITGSAQPKLSQDNLNKILIALPPLAEQKRIMSEIERWFSLIDIIESGKVNLKSAVRQAKAKILDLAIHGKLVPQDPTDEPALELLHRINPTAEISSDNAQYGKVPFVLPKSWVWIPVRYLFVFIRNGAQIKQNKSKLGLPITRIESISTGVLEREHMGYANITDDTFSSYYLQTNDILMSHINSAIHVGKSALCQIEKGEKIIHGMNLLCLRPYEQIDAKYIDMYFKSNIFRQAIRPYVKNAVNQASLNIANLSAILIPFPPIAEQRRIVSKIEQLFAQLDLIGSEL